MLGLSQGWFVLTNTQHAGFTLIELVIVVAISGVLLALGLPSFNTWTQNAKIRTAAGAIQNGLQLARGEAVRRNALIRFQLTSTVGNDCILSTTSTNWVVSFDNPAGSCSGPFLNEAFPVSDTANNPAPRIIQVRTTAEGSSSVAANADQSTIIFNGLGRANTAATIDVNQGTNSCTACRTLRVAVSTGGQIRMCDPNLPAGDPQTC